MSLRIRVSTNAPRARASLARAAAVLATVVVLGALATHEAWAQQAPRPPGAPPPGYVDPIYGNLGAPAGGPLVGPAVQAPQPATPDQVARRARAAARAGEVVVSVGELEDYLLASPSTVQDTFRSPSGRRAIVERLLRAHLLAIEAERRGASDPATTHAVRRRVERVLIDLLEEQVRAEAAAAELPEATPPVWIPEERFGVILRGSRAVVETWRAANTDVSFHVALEHARAVGDAQETPYAQRDAAPDAVEAPLWRALWELDAVGQVSSPIAVGRGRFAAVLYAGTTGGIEQPGPDPQALAMLAGDRAMEELGASVMEDRVSYLELERVDGVTFRMPGGTSPEILERLAAQAERDRLTAAAGEAAAAATTGEEPE